MKPCETHMFLGKCSAKLWQHGFKLARPNWWFILSPRKKKNKVIFCTFCTCSLLHLLPMHWMEPTQKPTQLRCKNNRSLTEIRTIRSPPTFRWIEATSNPPGSFEKLYIYICIIAHIMIIFFQNYIYIIYIYILYTWLGIWFSRTSIKTIK